MQSSSEKLNHWSLLLMGGVAATGALVYTQSILVPLVISLFIYASTLPLSQVWERKLKLPRPCSLALTFLMLVGVLSGIGVLVTHSIGEFVESAGQYRQRLLQFVEWGAAFAENFGVQLDQEHLKEDLKKLPILKIAKSFTGGAASFLGNLGLIFVMVMFLVMGSSSSKKQGNQMTEELFLSISRYINVKLMLSLATGLLVWIDLVW